MWNAPLVQLLRSLPALGLARGGRQARSVEQEVLWRLRRLPLRQLVQLAEHLVGQGHDGLLLSEVLRKLELRWTELEGTRTVVTLMAKVGHLSPTLMERLEDKVGPHAWARHGARLARCDSGGGPRPSAWAGRGHLGTAAPPGVTCTTCSLVLQPTGYGHHCEVPREYNIPRVDTDSNNAVHYQQICR